MANSLSIQILPTTTDWVVYSNIKNISTEPVDINGVTYSFTSYIDVQHVWGDWEATYTVDTEVPSGGNKKTIITLNFSGPKLLQPGQTEEVDFDFLNGPLNSPDDLKNLVALAKADPAAKASLELQAALPSAELQSLKPSVRIQGLGDNASYDQSVALNWGEVKVVNNLFFGSYTLTPQAIETENAYYVPVPSTDTITLDDDEPKSFSWSFEIKEKAFVEFTVPPIPVQEVEDFDPLIINVLISSDTTTPQLVPLKLGQTSEKITLIAGVQYTLNFGIISVNNLRYGFKIVGGGDGVQHYTPFIGENEVSLELKTPVPMTYSSCPVTINVQGVNDPVSVRLQRLGSDFYYYATITAANPSPQSLQKVRLGSYSVDANLIYKNTKPYKPDLSQALIVQKAGGQCLNTPYVLIYKEAFNLRVKNWPNHLAHGGITDGSLAIRQAYIDQKIPINALFRYAGTGGDGDPGVILADSVVQGQVSAMVADTQALKSSQAGQPVVGVFVIYTFQLSGGTNTIDVTDPTYLMYHYVNTIKYAVAAQKNASLSPTSFVINPDTIGMLQQQRNQSVIQALYEEGSIEVTDQLANALNYLGFSRVVPEFSDKIQGYCQSLNWIINQFSPDLTFGWQINVWQTGSANWVIDKNASNYATAPEDNASEVVSFLNNLEVYTGEYKPHFIVFDKYERDDFGDTARQIGYAYGGESWQRYLRYTGAISQAIHYPAMLWQIPGAHMPMNNEKTEMVIATHSGSGGSFFMGDSRVATHISLLKPELLALTLPNTSPYGANTVGALLTQDNNYNWSVPQLKNALLGNTFAILWGGGQTTSVVSLPTASGTDKTWLPDKLKAYYEYPLPLIEV